MPPWPPSARSPHYVGQARRTLDARERETLVGWARAQLVRPGSARRGHAGRRRLPPSGAAPRQGESRLELAMPVDVPARRRERLDRRLPLLPARPEARRETRSSRRRRSRPASPSIVHHVILYRLAPAAVAEATALDRSTPGPGWTCFGGPRVGERCGAATRAAFLDDAGWIAAWAPGWGGDRLRDGDGRLAPGRQPDRDAGPLQPPERHAPRPLARRADDGPGDSRPLTPVQTVLLPAPVELACRKGESGSALRPHGGGLRPGRPVRRRRGARLVRAPAALRQERVAARRVAGDDVRPHRRPAADDPGGRRPHASARPVDPGRAEPRHAARAAPARDPALELPLAGDVPARRRRSRSSPATSLRVTCRHDASLRRGEPRYVLWGEGTTDEMCLGVLQVTPAARPRAPCASCSSRRCTRGRTRPTSGRSWPSSSAASRRAGTSSPGRSSTAAAVDARHLALARDVASTARRFRPDVVYAHFLVPAGLLAALAGRAPAVLTAHGQDVENAVRSRARARARPRLAVRRAAAVVAVSDWLRGAARGGSSRRPAGASR